MARTKASVGAKVASGKSSKARCSAAPTPSSSGTAGPSTSGRSSGGGGNPVCPRETPKWQRPITNFFMGAQSKDQGSSSSRSKRNIIHSDSEDEDVIEISDKPKNQELDETLELEPLTGEESRKIDEFFPKSDDVTENGGISDPNGEDSIGGKATENGENEMNIKSKPKNGKIAPKGKGKGVGKKTKQKENIDSNVEKRNSIKRDLEDISFEESPQNTKKIKVGTN